MSGEQMAADKLRPPTPTQPAWVAFVVVFIALFFALLCCPIWLSAYLAIKVLKRIRAQARRFRFNASERPAPGTLKRFQPHGLDLK
jgi:hypothetical protein